MAVTELGGPKPLIAEVKCAGRQPGPMSIWVTAGVEIWGFSFLDKFFADCKAAGVDPLVNFWTFGDRISPTGIRNGVDDQYQKTANGQPVRITVEKAVGWAKIVAAKAHLAGVAPYIVIENEFSKGGCESQPLEFAAYFDRVHAAVKETCPAARTVFSPGIWSDMAVLGRIYAPQIAKADLIGLQTLLFAPRHPVDQFRNAGAKLAAAFRVLRGTTTKPACIVDLGFSSYGGPYSKTHPFAGGNGTANEVLQSEAIASVAAGIKYLDVRFVVYRSLQDNPTFNVANYGGESERHLGLVRADGTKKAGYAALMGLASLAPTQAELDALEARHRAALAELDVATGKLTDAVADLHFLRDSVTKARDLLDAALPD